jgi:hypothetical protein
MRRRVSGGGCCGSGYRGGDAVVEDAVVDVEEDTTIVEVALDKPIERGATEEEVFGSLKF